MRIFLLITVLFFKTINSFSQTKELDSLKRMLLFAKADTIRIILLNDIGVELININPDSAIHFIQKANGLSKLNKYTRGEAISLNYLGRYYSGVGHFDKSIDYFLQSLSHKNYYEENVLKGITYYDLAMVYGNLRSLSQSEEFLDKQVHYFKESIKALRTIKSNRRSDYDKISAAAYTELGRAFANQNIDTLKLDSANYYFNLGSQFADEIKSDEVKFQALEGMANVYYLRGQPKKSIAIALKMLKSIEKLGNPNFYYGMTSIKLGDYYAKVNADSAEYFFNRSIECFKKSGIENQIFLSNAYEQIGQFYFHKKKYNKAIEHLKLQLAISSNIGNRYVERTYWMMAESYKGLGDYKNAYTYHERYAALKDSLLNTGNAEKIARLQSNYETQLAKDKINLLESEAKVRSLQLTQNRNRLLIFISIAILLLISGAFLFYRYRWIKNAKVEQEKTFKELDELKSRFFSNVSHEFRTPLTLILAPLEKRLRYTTNQDDRSEFSMMHRNANRLLKLVNQLLDLSRLEAHKLELKAVEDDLIPFIRSTVGNFDSAFTAKNIQLRLTSDQESVILFFDPDKMEKIITNLLSNALKFTNDGGTINIHTKIHKPTTQFSAGYVSFTISDDGIGIKTDHLPKLFERFYQADSALTRQYEGSGIGLALTKELVSLHKGTISVTSEFGMGTEFTLCFPLGKNHLNNNEFSSEIRNTPIESFSDSEAESIAKEQLLNQNADTLLLIEDNDDLRNHLSKVFSSDYKVVTAVNGEQGVEIALAEVPDLIISDLMMPKLDGLEVCRLLKKDERTNHIPIILLTAKVDIDSRIAGLRTGADDYIAKPFSLEEIIIRVKNLVEGRRLLKDKLSGQYVVVKPSELKEDSASEKFIKKAALLVEENLANTSFGVEIFAHEMGMSSAQLYRKITALTHFTPNEFIRHMRLTRAHQLLEINTGNVAEIAYQCGFNNLSYFAKVFKEKFGKTPSEVKEVS